MPTSLARHIFRASPAFACAMAVVLAAYQGPDPTVDAARKRPAGEARTAGGRTAAALRLGEAHRYRLPLRKGMLLRLIVDQKGIDVAVTLEDPAGARLLRADRPIGDRGPELVLAVADRSGEYGLVIQGIEGGPGRYEAHIDALRPASEADRRSAEAYRLFTSTEDLEPKMAMAQRQQALDTWRDLGEVALEAEALARLARQQNDAGESRQAADLNRAAADAFERAGDRRWQAISLNNLGAALLDLGEGQEAVDQYSRALPLARREGDPVTQAKALHGLGQAFQGQGELQKALDRYREALALWPKGDVKRPYTLHQLGVLYARFFHDARRGREKLREALAAWGPGEEAWQAATLSQLGRLSYEGGRPDQARRYYEQALALRKSDRCGNSVLLARLALAEEARRARPAADARMAEALGIVRTEICPRQEPTVHLLDAGLAEGRGDHTRARQAYQRCETLYDGLGNRIGVAESLAGAARAARALGDRQAAREASRRALDILESVRPTLLSEDLRISFFSGARQAFDFHIDLLREMGAGEEAWATAERARARALGDLLAEAGAGLRKGTAPGLVARERVLQRQLNLLESRRLKSESKPKELEALRREIDARVADLEALRGEIRRRSPAYASLTRPEPVTLATTRRELLDDDTLLLEYRLGDESSTVWAITRDSLTTVRLPPRRQIEPAVREAAHSFQNPDWPNGNPPPVCEASRLLLAPVARFLGHRRVVVVADGALEALSFAALPMPTDPAACPRAPALVDAHEIVALPSVAALLAQRHLLARRRPAPRWLAVVADPAYATGSGRRLPGSAAEAKAITAGLPPGKVFLAMGAGASLRTVAGGSLYGFRVVHFAVHGHLDPEQPLLSALALSDGDLPADEIYGLDLPAELVVLSACETALGREVPGEGLVSGLPRAFLYAGAARVLVSLWAVDDQSTRDLMVLFYRGLFQGLPPARALQEAQRTLRGQAGSRPYQWAGFVLLGDWSPLPPFSG
jgi:CHAT domain-containing protein